MWEREPNRLALVELWAKGSLRLRQSQTDAFDDLSRLPWTRRTSRRNELALDPPHKPELETLLDRAWPAWREVVRRLESLALPIDERGWRRLCDLDRQQQLPTLPERLNIRTATAAVAPHSKATLSASRLEPLADLDLTHDGSVRLRPNAGLRIEHGTLSLDAVDLATVLGEVAITDRAFRDGSRLTGELPRALLFVENKGTFIDLDPPEGWLVAHVPGWDTSCVQQLLEQLPTVPVVHFGDLDPNGVRIVRHLRTLCPGLRWAIPDFWSERVPSGALPRTWPDDLDVSAEPLLVRDLAARGLWLEQERLALDPRLEHALVTLLSR